MFNLLKADFYKLVKGKVFWFSVLACVGIGLIHVLIPNAPADLMGIDSGLGTLELLATNFHIQIFVAFVAIFVTVEFQLGTIKNTISRGVGRLQIYFSKFIVTAVGTVGLLLIYILIHVVLGTMRWGFNPYDMMIYEVVCLIALHALFVIAYTAFFMLIAILFRSLAGALVTSYLYLIIMMIILPAEGRLVRYELDWIVRNHGMFESTYTNGLHANMVVLAWIVVSLVLGIVIFKRQDIK